MKPLGKILEETTIESSVGFNETIAKLREQQGEFCCKSLPDVPFLVTCDENGIINMGIRYKTRHKTKMYKFYYVCGEVLEQDGKTIVKIKCVKNTMYFVLSYIIILLLIVFSLIHLIRLLYDEVSGEYVRFRWIGNTILGLIAAIFTFKDLEKFDKKSAVYALKNNLIERVNNIERKNQEEHSL